MKKIFSSKYNNFFNAGLLIVVLTFFYVRPLHSPWHPFIAGDGLGYYSYLPAKFIHNDPNLDFKWFNKVYNANYVYSSFDNPEDNLLVEFNGKRINKYYQGLSFIWMPFFAIGHVLAKTFHFPPDGFSAPYQLMMGLASLLYLLMGLIFLRLLLLRLFLMQWISVLVPFLIFYGTPLFNFAIFANTLSHAYSFTFITGFLYFSLRFFRDPGRKTLMLILAALFFVITICIRPLNGLSLLLLFAFIPNQFFSHKIVFERIRLLYLLPVVIALAALWHQFSLTYIQTGSIFAYTYTDEKFDFVHNHFLDSFFSFNMGQLWYFPIVLLSLIGLFFMNRRTGAILFFVFLGLIFIYSSWWYWPIVKRAVIDFYAVPAIGLGGFLNKFQMLYKKAMVIAGSILMVIFFQFKNWQISAGILDEFLTYKELYFRNFFRLNKANLFPIPPSSIIKSEVIGAGINSSSTCKVAEDGKNGQVALIDDKNFICTLLETDFPELFNRAERRKMLLSFNLNTNNLPGQLHVFFEFKTQNDSTLLQVPFYISEDHLHEGEWDYKEFGYDLGDRHILNGQKVKRIKIVMWNVDAKRTFRVQDLKLAFLLTDESFETSK